MMIFMITAVLINLLANNNIDVTTCKSTTARAIKLQKVQSLSDLKINYQNYLHRYV